MKVLGRLRTAGQVPTYHPHEKMFQGEMRSVGEDGAPVMLAVIVPPGPEPWRDGIPEGEIVIPATSFEWWVVLPEGDVQ